MKYDVEKPSRLIDISRLGLDGIEDAPNGGLRLGARVSNNDAAYDATVARRYPLLSSAFLAGATGQLRNMATIGGNLLQRTRCYYFYDVATACNKREPGSGCPAKTGVNRIHAILGASESCIAINPSDMNVALAALGASVRVAGPSGERVIPFADFHRLPGDEPQRDTTLRGRRDHHRRRSAGGRVRRKPHLPQAPRSRLLCVRARFGRGRPKDPGRRDRGRAHRALAASRTSRGASRRRRLCSRASSPKPSCFKARRTRCSRAPRATPAMRSRSISRIARSCARSIKPPPGVRRNSPKNESTKGRSCPSSKTWARRATAWTGR